MSTEDTMLAHEALFRDHGRYHGCVDHAEQPRIMNRMIDTVMDLVGCDQPAAEKIVVAILMQDPSSASQLRLPLTTQ